MSVRIHVGDALEVLRGMPAESVQCCVSSPPYWGLRSYRGDDGMIGLEETFDAHLSALVAVFREVRRVLRADGCCFVNYGDAYVSGQGGRQSAVGEMPQKVIQKQANPRHRDDVDVGSWSDRDVTSKVLFPSTKLKPKDLMMMPARVALALQADGWWLRSEIVWHKPNPMPESVTDRPTSAHEMVYLLTKAPRYFYDAEAVRVAIEPSKRTRPPNPKDANGDEQHNATKLAERLQRDAILIEISAEYAEMARKRIQADATLLAQVEVVT